MLTWLLKATALGGQIVYEDLDLKELLMRSEFALVVRMQSPPWSTEEVLVNAAKPQCGTYPLARYHFTVVDVLKGRSSTQPSGVVSAAGAQAGAMLALSRDYCDTGVRKSPSAHRYAYGLTGIRQGQEVIVFLNRDAELGYELTAQNGFEAANSTKRIRKWALKGY